VNASGEQIWGGPAEHVDFAALGRVLWRYKFLIGGVGLATALLAVVLALTATEIFRAQVVVTETRPDGFGSGASLSGQLGGLASLVGVNLPNVGASPEAKAILESRNLAQEFVRRYVDLQLLLPNPKPPRTLWRAVERFRDKVLSISEDSRKGRITVTMDWTDPAIAARWANDFAALANELVRTRAIDESTRNIAYLNEQLIKTDVVETRRVLYNLMETETNRLMLAKGRAEYAFTIVDPAVPAEVRRSPQRTLMVLLGGVIGGILGVIVALVHHALARRRAGRAS
jgi:uncharacterized protein involved in exopolysaccharide biosynthesis